VPPLQQSTHLQLLKWGEPRKVTIKTKDNKHEDHIFVAYVKDGVQVVINITTARWNILGQNQFCLKCYNGIFYGEAGYCQLSTNWYKIVNYVLCVETKMKCNKSLHKFIQYNKNWSPKVETQELKLETVVHSIWKQNLTNRYQNQVTAFTFTNKNINSVFRAGRQLSMYWKNLLPPSTRSHFP